MTLLYATLCAGAGWLFGAWFYRMWPVGKAGLVFIFGVQTGMLIISVIQWLPLNIGLNAGMMAFLLWTLFRNRKNKGRARKLIGDKSRAILEKMRQSMGGLAPRPVLEGS